MLLSLLIPTYNYVDGVKRIINNLPRNIFEKCEVLVFDNSTNDLVKNYISKVNLPIIYKKNINFGNPCENWNDLIATASGKYVQVMHHDEFISNPDVWAKLLDQLSSDKDLYICDLKLIKDNKTFPHVPKLLRKHIVKRMPHYLFQRNVIGPCACLVFKKKLNISFDNKLIWSVDVDFYLKAIEKSKEIEFLRFVTIYSFQRDSGTITQEISENLKKIKFKEHILLLEKFNKRTPIWLKRNKFSKLLIFFERCIWLGFRLIYKLIRKF